MHHILRCEGTFDISAHSACHQVHQRLAGTGQTASTKNINDSKQHHLSDGILLKEYIFSVPGQIL